MRPVPFGHLGDGNIHMNLRAAAGHGRGRRSWRATTRSWTPSTRSCASWAAASRAEHGVGQLKPYMMPEWRGGAELDAMRRIKAALDPHGIMNPGKVLPP